MTSDQTLRLQPLTSISDQTLRLQPLTSISTFTASGCIRAQNWQTKKIQQAQKEHRYARVEQLWPPYPICPGGGVGLSHLHFPSASRRPCPLHSAQPLICCHFSRCMHCGEGQAASQHVSRGVCTTKLYSLSSASSSPVLKTAPALISHTEGRCSVSAEALCSSWGCRASMLPGRDTAVLPFPTVYKRLCADRNIQNAAQARFKDAQHTSSCCIFQAIMHCRHHLM